MHPIAHGAEDPQPAPGSWRRGLTAARAVPVPAPRQRRAGGAADLVAASLLTTGSGAEVHLVARDGRRVTLATDEATARAILHVLWPALERID